MYINVLENYKKYVHKRFIKLYIPSEKKLYITRCFATFFQVSSFMFYTWFRVYAGGIVKLFLISLSLFPYHEKSTVKAKDWNPFSYLNKFNSEFLWNYCVLHPEIK